MTATCAVTGCERPSQAMLCGGCEHALRRDLEDVGGLRPDARGGRLRSLVAELGAACTRHERLGSGDAGIVVRVAERPVPFRDDAARAAAALANTITTWARDVAETIGHQVDADTTSGAARFLLRYRDTIRNHPAVGEMFADITSAVSRARRAVDRRPERVYLGGCSVEDCDGAVYARSASPIARCDDCGAYYDVDERRGWLLEVVADWTVTRAEIMELGGKLYPSVKSGTVRSWLSRGTLMPTGHDPDGQPRYRIGDVVELATRAAASPARRAS